MVAYCRVNISFGNYNIHPVRFYINYYYIMICGTNANMLVGGQRVANNIFSNGLKLRLQNN